jgi:hypothetical protein
MQDREKVEIKPGNTHHRVIRVDLVFDGQIRKGVPHKGKVVIGAAQRLEERRARGKEGNILDIRVVFLDG